LGSPLEWAICHNASAIAELLLKKGANPNGQPYPAKHIPSPLIISIASHQPGIALNLIELGADVNANDPKGWNVLHAAAETGDCKVIQCLLEKGADPNYAVHGQSPLDLAIQNEKWDAVKLLKPVTTIKTSGVPLPAVDAVKQPSAEEQQRAAALKAEGNLLYDKQDYEGAIAKYTEAISANPHEAVFYTNRSLCYLQMKKPQQALEDALAAKVVNKKWVKAYLREGEAWMELGEYSEAAAAFFEGLNLEGAPAGMRELFEEAVKLGKEKHAKSQQI
jgi:tetratricopeptide (TPR) repeat protein